MTLRPPELYLHQAQLPQVSAELEGAQDGVLLRQHDECGAGQAAVDVQAEPAGTRDPAPETRLSAARGPRRSRAILVDVVRRQ